MRSRIILVALLMFILLDVIEAGTISRMLCKQSSQYKCYTVKAHDSWESLFSNSGLRDLVMRINRINIPLYRGQQIAIPVNQYYSDLLDHSPLPRQIDPPHRKLIYVSINPAVLAWGAYNSAGNLVAWGPAVGGRGWCPDINRGCHTRTGNFTIYSKQGAGCVSTKFPVPRGGAPMPYCMFFNGGFALHGSYQVPGYNASHGCVRLFVPDAKWLNQEFVGGERNVAVVIDD
ncbi:MAG: L,D-transpeptidase [Gammaproteobacteria bacterium]|nr:L,D-transpeptidase [Gammaproteobacteria bacterium]